MARSERNARHDDRFPAIDPYFDLSSYAPSLGFQARDSRDFTGYSTQDSQLPLRLREIPIDAEVRAPLGGELVGRVAPSSYGNAEGPAPGSYLQGLDSYPLYGFGSAGAAPAGACSTRAKLGIPPGAADDTSFAGVGTGMFLTGQHAMGRAPLPGATSARVGEIAPGSAASYDGVTSEHVLRRIRGYASGPLYDGGDLAGYGGYAGDVGGGDYGNVAPSEELANIRRENDSGDEFAGDGWDGPPERREDSQGDVYAGFGRGARPPSAYDRRRVRNSDYDR